MASITLREKLSFILGFLVFSGFMVVVIWDFVEASRSPKVGTVTIPGQILSFGGFFSVVCGTITYFLFWICWPNIEKILDGLKPDDQ